MQKTWETGVTSSGPTKQNGAGREVVLNQNFHAKSVIKNKKKKKKHSIRKKA